MLESKNINEPLKNNDIKTFVIYHRVDLDGLFGGWICKRACENPSEVFMVPQHYGDPIDLEQMKGHKVIMVDFSLPKEQMLWLNVHTDFTWIDHHKSAIEAMAGIDIKGIRSTEEAACKLALDYFDPEKLLGLGVYECINMLSEYDAWHSKNPKFNSDIVPYQFGVRHRVELDMDLVDKFIVEIQEGKHVSETIKNLGSIIIENNRIMWKQWMRKSGVIEMARKNTDGTLAANPYRCLALFGPAGGGSQIFQSVYSPELHDLMVYISYNITNKEFSVSLYSTKDDIDASALAKQFGGGGHHGAAGFSCKTLPFEI